MKTIAVITFVAGMLFSPVILLQTLLMPQLNELREFYANIDATTQKVLDGTTVVTASQ